MNLWKSLSVAALCVTTVSAFAIPPRAFITNNTTGVESNAFIDGTIPSAHPTHPYASNAVSWVAVRMMCFNHAPNNNCTAVVKMETNTAEPKVIGQVTMNLVTGDITPKMITGNGYSLVVDGPGKVTLYKVAG
ncbi:MAG: hypothetical protein K2X39_09500 [Silvanigrellaceae bacterium]|nr:hypothetical protein [Silvanigrellaceae bacterium]